ncbi:MAG: NADP-dependent phosphogluconate dehydrogenase [Dehalococcoidia bacterium]
MSQADIGLIGLAVMGQNLVLNMERNGATVAVYNRTTAVTRAFMEERGEGKNIIPAYESLEEFVSTLKKPRRVMLMVKAGGAVDAVIGQLKPYLDQGDLIIDGGNSNFKDTTRREEELTGEGFQFIGTGVSGGEEGALYGPSIMPGGSEEGYALVEDLFKSIAAKAHGEPCCMYIGKGGAGHFVKMVHNGIEYGDMQLIAECYHLMKSVGMKEPEIADVFERWNDGRLDSYLIQITAEVLRQKDYETDRFLVEQILDRANQKGTGMWMVQYSLDLGIPVPTIYAAVLARVMSSQRDERQQLANVMERRAAAPGVDRQALVQRLESALYAAKIASYAQGMRLIQHSGTEYGFGELDLGGIAAIWRAGCIIRARFLNDITKAYRQDPGLLNLVASDVFARPVNEGVGDLVWVSKLARDLGVPTPAMDASFSYLLSITAAELPGASLVQAQRDYFGAHTYERRDKSGAYHTRWMDEPRVEEEIVEH